MRNIELREVLALESIANSLVKINNLLVEVKKDYVPKHIEKETNNEKTDEDEIKEVSEAIEEIIKTFNLPIKAIIVKKCDE